MDGRDFCSLVNLPGVSLIPEGNGVRIQTIIASQRGEGRKFMTELCRLADEHGVVICLTVRPLTTPEGFLPTEEQLLRFYKEFGFLIAPQIHSFPEMVREVFHGS